MVTHSIVATVAAATACGGAAEADPTRASPAEIHRYVVDSVGKDSLTMHIEGCPTAKATATWFPDRRADPHAAPTDFACLARIPAGKTIVHSVQMFENPKLQPKRMIVRRLDGCSATGVHIAPDPAPCPGGK